MGVLFDLALTETAAADAVTGTELGWPTPQPLPAPVNLATLGEQLRGLHTGGRLTGALASTPMLLGDLAVSIGFALPGDGAPAVAGPQTLVDVGSLRLELVPDAGGAVALRATVVTASGTTVAVAPLGDPRPGIEVTAAVTGASFCVFVDGALATRRPCRSTLVPTGPELALGDEAGVSSFVLLDLTIADAVPAAVADAMAGAAADGVGEIDAHAARLGGLGGAQGEEQRAGRVRWRRYVAGTAVWTPATGAHAVSGRIEERYWHLGGPLGVLGALVADEESVGGYLRGQHLENRTPWSGLRFDDVVVERVPRPPKVVDFEAGRRKLDRRVAELAAQPGTEGALFRAGALNHSVLALEPEAVASGGRISTGVRDAVEALRAGRLRVGHGDGGLVFSRIDDEPLHIGNLHARARGVLVGGEEPVVIDITPAVVEDAAAIATAFVRNGTVSTVLDRLVENHATAFADLDATGITALLEASDRVGAVSRFVDGSGAGWVLTGPRLARFERGMIVWAPGTGAHEVLSDIAVHWLRLGGVDGFLGLPLEPDTAIPGGRRLRFAGGTIYWSVDTGAHEVHGDIAVKYDSMGGASGFGFPTSDEMACAGGRVSSFQGGDIYWSAGRGAYFIRGAIREAYNQAGGVDAFGVPVTDEYSWTADADPAVQVMVSDFADGRSLAWSPDHGVFDHVVLDLGSVSSGDIDDEYTSDDQPELYIHVKVWVDGVEVASGRQPGSGYGATTQALDGFAPIRVPLRAGGAVRLFVEAWDEDTGPNDKFAVHDVTYTFEGALYGYLTPARGSHQNAASTWNDPNEAGPGAFKTSYTLAPPFDELARFGEFRQKMFFGFDNFTSGNLPWDMFAETFENVVETNDNILEDVARMDDTIYYHHRYKKIAHNGSCFGFSVMAGNTFHRRTGLAQPLVNAPLDPALHRLLNVGQGIQANETVTLLRQLQFGVAGFIDPRKVFARVELAIAQRQPVLLCMRGKSGGKAVGHCTVAYRTDGSSWPKRIWIADPNFPAIDTSDPRTSAVADDNLSRIEIDQNGAFRMFEGAATASMTYGAGAWNGTLGDSYIYDTSLAFVQPPHFTPNWLIWAGLPGLMASIFVADGAVDVQQVSGGDYEMFGDQRGRLAATLKEGRMRLSEARSAGLLDALQQAEHAVPIATSLQLGGPGPLSLASISALSDQLGALSIAGSLHEGIASVVEEWATAANGWGRHTHGTLEDGIAALDDSISSIVVDAVLERQSRLLTPGAWPGMTYIPSVEHTDSEMFALRGIPPEDVRFDLRGTGGDFTQSAMSRLNSASVRGAIGEGDRRTVAFEHLGTGTSGVRIESSEESRVDVTLASASDQDRSRWVAWQTELHCAPAGPSRLARDGSELGVRITAAGSGPLTVRAVEQVDSRVVADARWRLDASGGATVVVTPADAASPFGARSVRSFDASGGLIDEIVVDPMR